MTARTSGRRSSARAAAAAGLLVAAAGCGGAPTAGAPAPGADPLAGLDAYVAGAVDDWEVPGLSIAVVKDGQVVFAEGYGVRELGGQPVDENTLFAIGSNTKLFTAVAAGMMVDEGRMDWDAPATEYLPWFRLHDPYVTREIRLRDLLSHRSGLGRRGDMLWYGSEYDREEVLRRIRHLVPNSSFRSEFGYQNIMFLAAGEATAAAAETAWDDLIRQRIFVPLGMDRSGTSTLELERQSNVAAPHVREDGRLVEVPYRNLDNVAPAGSINSSAAEMAEWLKLLLADGVAAGDTLIRPATLEEIFTPHTLRAAPADTLFPAVNFSGYGLGIGIQDYRGRKALVHTGGIDGMLSMVGLLPELDLGVVVLTSVTERNNLFTALVYSVFDRYLAAQGVDVSPVRDWSQALLARQAEQRERAERAQREAEAATVSGTEPSRALELYTGTYRHPMYGDATVSLEGGRLVLRRGPAFVGDLEHHHFNTFRADWRAAGLGSALVTFGLDFTGRPARLDVDGFDTFRRVDDDSSS